MVEKVGMRQASINAIRLKKREREKINIKTFYYTVIAYIFLRSLGCCMVCASTGSPGVPGARGSKGEPGANGQPGKEGSAGPCAVQCPVGTLGNPGLPGDPGCNGNPGEKGSSTTASMLMSGYFRKLGIISYYVLGN